MFKLIHNKAAGDLPPALARVHQRNAVSPAEAGIENCGRCGRPVLEHIWILRDPDDPFQGGVIDCEQVD